MLAFAAKDGSFTANLEQCNGCGGCLKQTPTMCPTFIATGEEIMSTRGRANAIRAALELRGIKGDPLRSPELEAALSNCLSCKACTTECPSNVNLALLKAELLHARIRRDGLNLRERLFSSVDQLGRLGLQNAARGQCASGILSVAMDQKPHLGHHHQTADAAFRAGSGSIIGLPNVRLRAARPAAGSSCGTTRSCAITNRTIGMAAVKVLEAAGFEVTLPAQRTMLRTARLQPGQSRRSRADWAATISRY